MKTNSRYTAEFITLFIFTVLFSNTQAQTSFNISNKTTGDTLLTIDNSGQMGLGITVPGAGFHMVHNNGALFSGTFGVGSIPIEGAGTRLMWYPAKSAFRVGSVNGTQWDDFNIGEYSIALGRRTTASGNFAQTYGNFSTASGEHSMALGRGATASGNTAIAIGRSIEASGDFSFAIGVGEQGGTVVSQDTTLAIVGGRVGFHTVSPSSAFEVADTVYSSFGGFKFPDGSVQQTAAGSPSQWQEIGSDIYFNSGNVGIGVSVPSSPLSIFAGTSSRGLSLTHNQTGSGSASGVFIDVNRSGVGNADAYGIRATATNDNGVWSTRGLYVTADGTAPGAKYGVFAVAQGIGNLYGVKGVASSTGLTPQYGIWGEAIGSGTGAHYGIYGTASGGGNNHWAGYFDGNVYTSGNLGIGTSTPSEMLEVADTIYSTIGGFKFPDGTVQGTAAGSGGVISIDSLSDGNTPGNSVFLGSGAGAGDDGTDNRNTAIGISALYSNLDGSWNAANGYEALYSNTSGNANTANGYNALYYNTTGHLNTANGYFALYNNTTGVSNVGLGDFANFENQEGSYNTIIGYGAGKGLGAHNKSGNVFLGYRAGYNETGDDKLYIENSDTSAPLIGGDFSLNEVYLNGNVGIGTSLPFSLLHIEDVDLSLQQTDALNELVTVEDDDAGLGLYSSDDGNYGSIISLGEITSGTLNNKWSLYRTTSTANPANQLRFSFGTNPEYWINPIPVAISNNGNVGIGTTDPSANLHVAGSDGALFTGEYDNGSIPVEGEGSRLMWYPAKAAFRAGRVYELVSADARTYWDDDSIGNYSFAAGQCTRATGWRSTAFGSFSNASGNTATAIGNVVGAWGDASTAMGSYSVAGGDYSFSAGRGSYSPGEASFAMGNFARAFGEFSTSIGDQAHANGDHSLATGFQTDARGEYSAAFGYNTIASGSEGSVAMGYETNVKGNASFAMGFRSSTENSYSMAVGAYSATKQAFSIALGHHAKAHHNASMVFAANADTPLADSVYTGGAEQMVFRADGGTYFTNSGGAAPYNTARLINTSTGAYLSSGGAWTNASSRDFKENITELSLFEAIDAVKKLNPVTYNYKAEQDENYVGFIAEDVPELAATKDRKGLSSMDIVAVLTKVVQDQQSRIEKLEQKINQMENAR